MLSPGCHHQLVDLGAYSPRVRMRRARPIYQRFCATSASSIAATNFTRSFIGDVSFQGISQLPRARPRVTHVIGPICHLSTRSEPSFCLTGFWRAISIDRGGEEKLTPEDATMRSTVRSRSATIRKSIGCLMPDIEAMRSTQDQGVVSSMHGSRGLDGGWVGGVGARA
jgi:hypothetical protein